MTTWETAEKDLAEALQSPEAGWGIGCYGAMAEFMRLPDEHCRIETSPASICASTARGGIYLRIAPGMRSIPFTGRSHREIALCLPVEAAKGAGRTGITELGPDRDALLAEHREHVLFDLGIGALQVDAYVRTNEPKLIAMLRSHEGTSPLDRDNPAIGAILVHSPHRIYCSPLGRIEVFQPIPGHDQKTPQGPHTHFNPKLLGRKRSHSPRDPIPAGWVPCAHLYFAGNGGPAPDAHCL